MSKNILVLNEGEDLATVQKADPRPESGKCPLEALDSNINAIARSPCNQLVHNSEERMEVPRMCIDSPKRRYRIVVLRAKVYTGFTSIRILGRLKGNCAKRHVRIAGTAAPIIASAR